MHVVRSSQCRIHQARRSCSITWSATHQTNGRSRLASGQVRTALRDLLERLIDQAEGVPIAVRDDDGVECATTGIAGTDPHRQAGHVRVGTADQPNA